MTEIRQILFPSDFTPESDRALEHARFLAERFGARLTLYHGLELPPSEWTRWGRGFEQEVWARVEERARQELARRAQGLKAPCEIVVETGLSGIPLLLDIALLDRIRQTAPDLVVMATRGRSGASAFFLGSVTQEVVRNANRPVLCVRSAAHGAVFPYRTLVVPTDLSEASRRAFPLAALLARACGARVVGVYVPPRPTVAALSGMTLANRTTPSCDELRRPYEPAMNGVSLDVCLSEPGAAWERIVQVASREQADLVVMATRGHDSVGDRILGSNTERVLRHAACPVLVA
jgi:nucleotide-binding universal stress UspA family protein